MKCHAAFILFLLVVACRAAVQALLPETWQQHSEDRLPFELVLAVNKIDALPRSAKYTQV